jgi:Major tropism determinant N-terminal domain
LLVPNRIQLRRDTGANWTSANPLLAAGEIGLEIDTNRSKFGDGVARWNELPYAIIAAFTDSEKSKLASVEPGAQANTVASVHGRTGAVTAQPGDYTADHIADTVNKVVMTAAERAKLTGVESGAQANTVASVHGRTGAVTAQPGDYSADHIADTANKVVMTVAERTKLTGIQAAAQVNPARVTAAEKTAGTATSVKGFAPLDVRDMVTAFAPPAPVSSVAGKTGAVALIKGDVGLGNVTNDAQLRADLSYAAKASPAAGDKLLLKDQADGQPKLVDWGQLPASGPTYSVGTLPLETAFDNEADQIGFRDASAGADRKIKPKSLGFPDVLSDPYEDRLIRVAVNNTDCSARLRQAIAAATNGATIKLEGMGVLSRDGANAWGLQLPSSKNLTIVGTGRGFHIKHADPASDSDAFTMIFGNVGGKSIHIENIVLESIWSRQSNQQEVAGARIINIRGARELRMFGLYAYDGVEMGLTAQDCGIVRVDRCYVERNTSDCINVNGRDVSITNSSAFYSGDACFSIYVPSTIFDGENYLHVASITDNTAKWTTGIKVAAPRVIIARNRLDTTFLYGIRTFTDEGGVGKVVPQEVSITDNHIYNVIANDQCWDASAINRAISVESFSRAARKVTIAGNHVASTCGPLWNGLSYGAPSTLKRGVAVADDPLGMYRKNGFIDTWEAPTIFGREPIHQRAAGLAIFTQAPIGASELVVRDNSLRDVKPTESRQVAFVAFKNVAGVDWAIPLVEAPWSNVIPQQHFLASPDIDLIAQKVRIEVTAGATTCTGAIIKAQFASQPNGPWFDLCAVTLDSSTNTAVYGPYIALPSTILDAPIYLRIAGAKGSGASSVAVTQVVLRFCRDGDAPRSLTDKLPLARLPEGAGETHARQVATPIVNASSRFLVLRPGVQKVVLPRASSLIKTVVLQNKSGGTVSVLANEGKVANGARFGGGGNFIDFLRSDLAQIPATFQKFTASFWSSFDTFDNWNFILSCFTGNKGSFDLYTMGSPGSFVVYGRNTAGSVVIDQRTTNDLATGTLYHFLVSCDLTIPAVKLRVSGKSVSWKTSGYTPVLTGGETVSLDSTNFRVGARSSATTISIPGNIAQVWFMPDYYVDLDVSGNVDAFYADGLAVNLGHNGWRPTGSPPALFLNGNADKFLINLANPDQVAAATGTLGSPSLTVPGQQSAYTIDGDGPVYALANDKSASFTTIEDSIEINKYARLGGM